jgi:cytochrome bd ubiquinol oxidase subunit I
MLADPLLLARAQFGLNIAFHILFPSITIALAWVLVYLRLRIGRHESGQAGGDNAAWLGAAYRLWVKIFALSFALGVVSGITMSFQFGTNWPGFMEKAGNIAGPLLGYEVLTAFFLEASFLGVMLFGRDRVPRWVHTASAVMVAIGTSLSAFWILALNSWMQTPQGFEMIDGRLHATDWWAIVFNPSFPYRLAHMMIASGLTDRRGHRGGADAGADPGRRSARAQYAGASAGEDRRDRGHLGNRARGAVAAVRNAQ